MVSSNSTLSFFSWYRERDIHRSGDFLYKSKFPLQKSNFYYIFFFFFLVSLMSAVFQIDQLEIVLLPKKHILEWHILVPYDIVYSDNEEICNFSRKGTH